SPRTEVSRRDHRKNGTADSAGGAKARPARPAQTRPVWRARRRRPRCDNGLSPATLGVGGPRSCPTHSAHIGMLGAAGKGQSVLLQRHGPCEHSLVGRPVNAILALVPAATIAAAAAALLAWSSGRWPDLLVDFGRELYLPWRIASGARLYADL